MTTIDGRSLKSQIASDRVAEQCCETKRHDLECPNFLSISRADGWTGHFRVVYAVQSTCVDTNGQASEPGVPGLCGEAIVHVGHLKAKWYHDFVFGMAEAAAPCQACTSRTIICGKSANPVSVSASSCQSYSRHVQGRC